MIKTKPDFLQMQVENMRRQAIEFCQMSFCKTPERFNIVNMLLTTGKFITNMMRLEVFIKSQYRLVHHSSASTIFDESQDSTPLKTYEIPSLFSYTCQSALKTVQLSAPKIVHLL